MSFITDLLKAAAEQKKLQEQNQQMPIRNNIGAVPLGGTMPGQAGQSPPLINHIDSSSLSGGASNPVATNAGNNLALQVPQMPAQESSIQTVSDSVLSRYRGRSKTGLNEFNSKDMTSLPGASQFSQMQATTDQQTQQQQDQTAALGNVGNQVVTAAKKAGDESNDDSSDSSDEQGYDKLPDKDAKNADGSRKYGSSKWKDVLYNIAKSFGSSKWQPGQGSPIAAFMGALAGGVGVGAAEKDSYGKARLEDDTNDVRKHNAVNYERDKQIEDISGRKAKIQEGKDNIEIKKSMALLKVGDLRERVRSNDLKVSEAAKKELRERVKNHLNILARSNGKGAGAEGSRNFLRANGYDVPEDFGDSYTVVPALDGIYAVSKKNPDDRKRIANEYGEPAQAIQAAGVQAQQAGVRAEAGTPEVDYSAALDEAEKVESAKPGWADLSDSARDAAIKRRADAIAKTQESRRKKDVAGATVQQSPSTAVPPIGQGTPVGGESQIPDQYKDTAKPGMIIRNGRTGERFEVTEDGKRMRKIQ